MEVLNSIIAHLKNQYSKLPTKEKKIDFLYKYYEIADYSKYTYLLNILKEVEDEDKINTILEEASELTINIHDNMKEDKETKLRDLLYEYMYVLDTSKCSEEEQYLNALSNAVIEHFHVIKD